MPAQLRMQIVLTVDDQLLYSVALEPIDRGYFKDTGCFVKNFTEEERRAMKEKHGITIKQINAAVVMECISPPSGLAGLAPGGS